MFESVVTRWALAGAGIVLAIGAWTTAAGAFTNEQAQRGRVVFDQACWECHGVDNPDVSAPYLWGHRALTRFETAQQVFDFASIRMPLDAPASLPEDDYWAVVSFLLEQNGHLPTDEPLGPSTAPQVRVHEPPSLAHRVFLPLALRGAQRP